MNIEKLQLHLDKVRESRLGTYTETWGCRNEVDTPSMIGWITISRQTVPDFIYVDPQRESERFAEWQEIANKINKYPYLVSVYEVNTEAYEAETKEIIAYMAPEDYGKRENFYLSSLRELPEILARFGKTVDDLVPQSELLAP
jgi:hypothetical protein